MMIGVVGGGQLARMMALAGHPLGLRFTFLDPAPDACAAALGTHLRAPFDDEAALAVLARSCDVVTYEFENIPASAIRRLADLVPVRPGAASLAFSQDRLREKTLFQELGIPTPGFEPVDSAAALESAAARIGFPSVLKTRTEGYDGRGQAVLRGADDMSAAWTRLGGRPLILERFVRFRREVSAILVRDRRGNARVYPLAENVHRDGILRTSLCRPADPLQPEAEAFVRRLAERLDHVGVIALELFDTPEGLVANEFAPRVHNSGHWTIEGASTSQFENHLRAVVDWPLGETQARGHVAMVNFIGDLPDNAQMLSLPGVHLHVYGKKPAPGRKVGHATVCAEGATALEAAVARIQERLPGERAA
jgi:5-(carboxyamino)imidazole ribonucleotide synthase